MAKSKLYLNGINIESVKLGSSDVKLYLGNTLVYPLGPSVNVTYDVATYDGNPQVAENIVVTDKSGNTLVENVDYVVTENNGGTNAGRYPLVLTFMGQYEGTFTTSFIINKVTPTVTAPTAITGLVYNASGQTLVNAGSTDYGTLKYSLDNISYGTSLPKATNVSSYTVYYKVDGDDNVNDVTANTITATIAKVTPTVVAPTAKVLTYNGSAQELVNAGSTNYGTLKYSLDNSTWSTSIPTATNYGSYTVYYKVDGDSNVNDVAAQSVACSINEKQVTATVELSQSIYTYNGSECEPTVTVKDGSTVIDPSEYTVTYSNNVNAGTATVTISDNVGGNYEVIGSTTFTINKADVTYTAPTTVSSLVYNGNAQELLNAGTVTGGTIKYSTDNVNWSTDVPSGTNASSYTSYWKIDGDANHNDIASSSIVTTIAKADSSLSFAVTSITVEKGQTKTNIATVNAGDGTVTYSSNNTIAITVDNSGVISGVSLGNATITANISQTQNYNTASASYSANCMIAITGTFNVTDTSSLTRIASGTSSFTKIEIDGVEMSVRTGYTFSTTGDHTVKYYLKDTRIGERAFEYCSDLTSIDIPDGVTSIGEASFYYCSSLTSCTIGDGVIDIGDYAFYNCSGLTSVNIPSGVTTIGFDAFRGCRSITSVTIPSGVTSIRISTFRDCSSLTSVTIPNSVTTIGTQAFQGCSSLRSIDIPNSVTSIGEDAFAGCSGLRSIDIPNSVTSISNGVFLGCSSLTSVTIPDTVTSIGGYAFSDCTSLKSIDIPSGVTTVSSGLCQSCSNLTKVEIPDTVTSIEYSAFSGCTSLKSIDIPSGVTSIGNYAFYRCSGLTSMILEPTIPPRLETYTLYYTNNCTFIVPLCSLISTYQSASSWNLYNNRIISLDCPTVDATFNVTSTSKPTKIAYSANSFAMIEVGGALISGITSYTFSTTGDNVVRYHLHSTNIKASAFTECSGITSVTINSGVIDIGDYAFYNCSGLTSIDIPNSVTSIGYSAFRGCRSITSVIIPSGVTSIGNNTFDGCSSLTSVNIPSGVTSIGSSIFNGCSGLTSIISNAVTAPTISNYTFRNVKTGGTLTVPIGSSGYDVWMGTGDYYLGYYNWTKVEQ